MEYHENDPWWDRLLKGRSGDILLTADAPGWFDQIMHRRPAAKQAKRLDVEFSGIKPVRVLQVRTVKTAKEAKIKKWLAQACKLGADAGRR